MFTHLKEIYAYRDMIYCLVRRELRGKYKGSVLGFLWTFINPLCQIVVYSIVFRTVFKVSIDNFYLYMNIGMMPWTFLNASLHGGSICIRAQADMVKKIYFPREVIPISFVTSTFINMLLNFLIVFLFLFASGFGIDAHVILYLPVIMIIQYLFVLGMVFFVSAITVYFRDMEQITGLILMMWIYVTPIMYNMEYVPQKYRLYIEMNPMTAIIEIYHQVLYYHITPTMNYWITATAAALSSFIVGIITFEKLARGFAEEI